MLLKQKSTYMRKGIIIKPIVKTKGQELLPTFVFFTSAHGPKKNKTWKTYTQQKHQTKNKSIKQKRKTSQKT
jgi:hypothetical protein